MNRLLDLLRNRLGVFETWPSFARVAAWVVVWVLVMSAITAPVLPSYTDREHPPDQPPSNVRYVGPLSRSDFGGFLPPSGDADEFNVAWIGGSEVKFLSVSVPGAFENRVDTVGGEPLVIDSYNLVAPRLIDVLRAVDTAIDHDADAVVIALNPAWPRTEWSMRDWTNLDVANIDTLWERPSMFSWGAALTSPADVGWRLSRAAFPLVEVQARLNERAEDESARFDIIPDPPEGWVPGGEVDPKLPTDPSSFWLVREHGVEILDDDNDRVRQLMLGIGVSQDEAEFFMRSIIETLDEAEIPVFMYTTMFSPEVLSDPAFDAAAQEVEAFWGAIAADVDSSYITIEPRSMSRDYDDVGTFIDHVHMQDPGPFGDILVERLCGQWSALDPDRSCE